MLGRDDRDPLFLQMKEAQQSVLEPYRTAIPMSASSGDGEGSAPVDVMDPTSLESYGKLCGWALARAHARSGDPIAIGSYLGTGDAFGAMAAFAERAADQNELDYEALRSAARAGQIEVRAGL